jgi:hypothetical protein
MPPPFTTMAPNRSPSSPRPQAGPDQATTTPEPAAYEASKPKVKMLRGAGIWEVHFSPNADFSEEQAEAAVKFGHRHDDTSLSSSSTTNLSGTPAQSLTFFGRNNVILFTDGRVFPVRAQKARIRRSQVIQVDVCVSSSIVVHAGGAEIVQNEARGDGTWVLIVKIKEGVEGLRVEQRNLDPSTHTPHPPVPGHDVLKLWGMRERVEKMGYFKVVVPDYESNKSWAMVLKQGVLGPVVNLAAVEDPKAKMEDREAANASFPARIRLGTGLEPIGPIALIEISEEDELEQGEMDPFKSVWEHARRTAKP